MPEPWFAQTEAAEARREHAMVPAGLSFKTKTEVGQEMLEVARRKLIASLKDADGNIIGLIQPA
jgi:hypothetical protein